MSGGAWGRLGLSSWGRRTGPYFFSHVGGCFLATMPLWVSTSHLSNGLMAPEHRRIQQGGSEAKCSEISIFTPLVSVWGGSRVMGYQRGPGPCQRHLPPSVPHTSCGDGPGQAGGSRVTLGRVTGAWAGAGRYYAQKAIAEDTNLNRQGIDGNFYLGRKSIEISR